MFRGAMKSLNPVFRAGRQIDVYRRPRHPYPRRTVACLRHDPDRVAAAGFEPVLVPPELAAH